MAHFLLPPGNNDPFWLTMGAGRKGTVDAAADVGTSSLGQGPTHQHLSGGSCGSSGCRSDAETRLNTGAGFAFCALTTLTIQTPVKRNSFHAEDGRER